MSSETDEFDDSVSPDSQSTGGALIVRLGAGIGLVDLAVEVSDCGQYLMLTCQGALVALIGAMGSDVESVEFADGSSYRVEELMDLVGA